MGKKIKINSKNIQQYSWIWEFLEQERGQGKQVWKKNKSLSYKDYNFIFEQTVFVRQRKNGKDYAYEMMSSKKLGEGCSGTVEEISCTISNGKGSFQAKDRQRVVKTQYLKLAEREYELSRRTQHLAAKKPTSEGRMVMNRMPGETLHNLLEKRNLSIKEKLDLTKAFIKTYQDQVLGAKLSHNDLHSKNVLIEQDKNSFKLNIIDYGFAIRSKAKNVLIYDDLDFVLKDIWKDEPNIFAFVHIRTWSSGSDPINHFIEFLEYLVEIFEASSRILSPNNINKISKVIANLERCYRQYPKTINSLMTNLKKGLSDSNAKDLTPLNQALLNCKQQLDKDEADPRNLCILILDPNPEKQAIFDAIYKALLQLEKKGLLLGKEGKDLCDFVANLRKEMFDVVCTNTENKKEVLVNLVQGSKIKLQQQRNLIDKHRNGNYILAEIGVIISSLIILYPLVASIHYARTGRFGLYSQTKASKAAGNLADNLETLENTHNLQLPI